LCTDELYLFFIVYPLPIMPSWRADGRRYLIVCATDENHSKRVWILGVKRVTTGASLIRIITAGSTVPFVKENTCCC